MKYRLNKTGRTKVIAFLKANHERFEIIELEDRFGAWFTFAESSRYGGNAGISIPWHQSNSRHAEYLNLADDCFDEIKDND